VTPRATATMSLSSVSAANVGSYSVAANGAAAAIINIPQNASTFYVFGANVIFNAEL
jgi:hypothetical protein